jgi:hypothetical protein
MRQLILLLTAFVLALVLWVEFRTRLSRSLKIVAWLIPSLLVIRLFFNWSWRDATYLALVVGIGGLVWLTVWYITGRIERRQTQR